jgi:hypothetical protein
LAFHSIEVRIFFLFALISKYDVFTGLYFWYIPHDSEVGKPPSPTNKKLKPPL